MITFAEPDTGPDLNGIPALRKLVLERTLGKEFSDGFFEFLSENPETLNECERDLQKYQGYQNVLAVFQTVYNVLKE